MAVWFTYKDLEAWTRAIGFSNAVDDVLQWRFKELVYNQVWEGRRWLPREARNKNYYLHEFRFTSSDIVGVYYYKFDAIRLYDITYKDEVTLLGATQGLSSATLAATLFIFLNSTL